MPLSFPFQKKRQKEEATAWKKRENLKEKKIRQIKNNVIAFS
jgi:hypothetical protein